MNAAKLTPKEAANTANNFLGNAGNNDQIESWLFNSSVKELHEFIYFIGTNDNDLNRWINRAKVALEVRLSEDSNKLADRLIKHTEELTKQTATHVQHTEKLTLQTDRLIVESVNLSSLTRVLIWLTVVLGVCAIVQIVIMVCEYLKHK